MAVPYGEDSEPPFRAGKVAHVPERPLGHPRHPQRGIRLGRRSSCPRGPAATPATGSSGAPMRSTPTPQHPEEAWKLAQALTQAEVQAKISAMGTNIPSRVSQEAIDAFLTFTPPANNQAFINGLQDNAVAEGPLWAGSWPDFAR